MRSNLCASFVARILARDGQIKTPHANARGLKIDADWLFVAQHAHCVDTPSMIGGVLGCAANAGFVADVTCRAPSVTGGQWFDSTARGRRGCGRRRGIRRRFSWRDSGGWRSPRRRLGCRCGRCGWCCACRRRRACGFMARDAGCVCAPGVIGGILLCAADAGFMAHVARCAPGVTGWQWFESAAGRWRGSCRGRSAAGWRGT